jgi:putative Mg2+ transporter-C (MgtC) family protein
MSVSAEDFIKIILALIIGGIIGAERERHNKAAGLRTMILICIGSCLFTIFSLKMTGDKYDPTRIASNIVVGIGFLGAGVILREGGRITGLTTAATIWLTAALGMGIGSGQYLLVALAALLVTIVLWIFPKFEERLAIPNEVRNYVITTTKSWEKFKELKSLFKEQNLVINNYKQEKRGRDMICTFEVYGPTKKHDRMVQRLLADKDVKETTF